MKFRAGLCALVVCIGSMERGTVGTAAELKSASWKLGPNLLGNGDFSSWPGYAGHGVTTTTVGVPANSIPKDWQGGPGVGATATYDVVPFAPGQTDVPGNPKQFFRMKWLVPPSADWAGDAVSAPGHFRATFIENASIGDVYKLAGQSVVFSFYGRVNAPHFDVVPLMWHSYDAKTPGIVAVKGRGFELFEASGQPGVVAVARGIPQPSAICHLTDRWQRFERVLTLPTTAGRSITPGHYTGTGFDFIERRAVAVDLANVEIRPILNAPPKGK